VHLLLTAQHRTTEFIWGGRKVILRVGQLLTGRKALSEETGIPESTVERILTYLESEQQIEQQKTNKFRVITLRNWQKYQGSDNGEQQSGQQADNKRTRTRNIKNAKNLFKYSTQDFALAQLLWELVHHNHPSLSEPNVESWADDIRKLREIDKRGAAQMEAVFRWSQKDDFWSGVCLSAASYRKKSKGDGIKRFERIEIQMKRGQKHGSSQVKRGFAQESAIGETIEA
jgi:hypothetical protein